MNKRPVLYLIMETKARELEGRAFIALEAARRGFQVILGHKTPIIANLLQGHFPPGIVFEKDIAADRENHLRKLVKLGCQLVVQDEESGLLGKRYESFLEMRSSEKTTEIASAIFCWGPLDHSAWTVRYPQSRQKIFLTGSPRVDYWRPDFDAYYRLKISKIQKKYGKFVLISSNFTTVNGYLSLEDRIAQARSNGSIKTPEDLESFKHRLSNRAEIFRKFVALIQTLATQYPDVNFVVRPHPAEKLSGWKDALGKISNVHVTFEGSINSWVRASIAILHNGCTTALEAYVTGIPTIAYTPLQHADNVEIPNKISIVCQDESSVSNTIAELLNGNSRSSKSEENDTILGARLANTSGVFAAHRICDVLERVSIPAVPLALPNLLCYWRIVKSEILNLKGRIFLGSERSGIIRKFPSLKQTELEHIKKQLTTISPQYQNLNIQKIALNTFLIWDTHVLRNLPPR